MREPFIVKDCTLISIATGEEAQNLRELSDRLEAMGRKAKTLVLNNFLVTRHLREYLTLLMFATMHEGGECIEL